MAGIAPHSPLRLALWAAGGLPAALESARPGDVVLIEGVYSHDDTQGNYPVESDGAVYSQILQATGRGVIVVEPAGNAGNNLDNTADPYAKPMMERADSGAIVVAAGEPPSENGVNCMGSGRPAERSRLIGATWSGTYGSMVDLQGYGDCVASLGTPGWKTLTPYETDPNKMYLNNFSGASAASPIVTGAAAVLQGIAKQSGTLLTPRQMRDLLASTGTPQPAADAARTPIGPLPNLKAAIAKLKSGTPG